VHEDRLKAVMSAILEVDPSSLNEDSSVETVPGWDSLQQMNLIIAIEDEFNIRLPEDELVNLTSLPALQDAVDRSLADRAAH
jgi:acyl carrier protein